MSKTADLRKLITAQLNTLTGATYYVNAKSTATYPYKVFSFRSVNLGTSRDDIIMQVDIWDKSTDQKTIETIADNMETLFDGVNLPQSTILPTIWRDTRYPVPEDDKSLQHIEMTFYIQNYTK